MINLMRLAIWYLAYKMQVKRKTPLLHPRNLLFSWLLLLCSVVKWSVQWIWKWNNSRAHGHFSDNTTNFKWIMTEGHLCYTYWILVIGTSWIRNTFTDVDGALRAFSREWDNKMTSSKYFESIRDLSPNPQRESFDSGIKFPVECIQNFLIWWEEWMPLRHSLLFTVIFHLPSPTLSSTKYI